MGDLIRMLPVPATGLEPLWRELAGRVLRRHRREHDRTLVDVADRAGISTQYLSEVERGRKDPSSEVLAAVAGALGLTMLDLTVEVARDLGARGRAGRSAGGSQPLVMAA